VRTYGWDDRLFLRDTARSLILYIITARGVAKLRLQALSHYPEGLDLYSAWCKTLNDGGRSVAARVMCGALKGQVTRTLGDVAAVAMTDTE